MDQRLTRAIVDELPVCGCHSFRREGMAPYALDSKGQAWSVGIHGGRLYKTQTRQVTPPTQCHATH